MPKKQPAAVAVQAPAPPGRLTISRLSIQAVMGVKESTIDLSDITVIAGGNASGKSSHLAALRAALGIDRTSLARITHLTDGIPDDGASVDVVLVGQDREVHVSRKGDGSPEVRERIGEDWRKVPRPVEWLRDLIDVQGANPATWLALSDEDKAAALLAAMPLEGYNRQAALAEAGIPDFRLPAIPAGLHPLEDLEQVEAAVFGSRTVINGEERAERDAAEKLLAGLPAEAPGDVAELVARGTAAAENLGADLARLEAASDAAWNEARRTIAATQERTEELLAAHVKDERARLRGAHAEKAAEIRAQAERRIAELAAEMETALDAVRSECDRQRDDALESFNAATEKAEAARGEELKMREGSRADLAAARERLAGLRAQQQSADTDRHVRAAARQAEDKADALRANSARLTRALEALKRYKLQLAATLPVQGLAVQFAESGKKTLTLNGVLLAMVNKARLAELATEVSVLRGARAPADGRPFLPIVLLDDLERLDSESRVALLRAVAARGSQIVAAVVTDEPLRVLRGEAALARVS